MIQKSSKVSVSAIVLAGGKSVRMGQDKALLSIEPTDSNHSTSGKTFLQQTFLQQICQVAQQCSDRVYVVTAWTERYRELLSDDIILIQEQGLTSDREPQGPLLGFSQGLNIIREQDDSEWILLLACDLPYLNANVIQTWIAQLPTVGETVTARLPQHPEGWWEPLCGLYRRRCWESLQEFIADGGRSFQRWLQGQSVEPLILGDRQMLFNCNTPADLTKLHLKSRYDR